LLEELRHGFDGSPVAGSISRWCWATRYEKTAWARLAGGVVRREAGGEAAEDQFRREKSQEALKEQGEAKGREPSHGTDQARARWETIRRALGALDHLASNRRRMPSPAFPDILFVKGAE
jgi:hypothetical protein